MKTCIKCGMVKPLDLFFRDSTKKSGRQSMCKVCKMQAHRIYKWKRKHDPDSIKKMEHFTPMEGRLYNTKLDKSDIILIRGLFGFVSNKDIAEKFEVSQNTISAIKTGRTWSWVK